MLSSVLIFPLHRNTFNLFPQGRGSSTPVCGRNSSSIVPNLRSMVNREDRPTGVRASLDVSTWVIGVYGMSRVVRVRLRPSPPFPLHHRTVHDQFSPETPVLQMQVLDHDGIWTTHWYQFKYLERLQSQDSRRFRSGVSRLLYTNNNPNRHTYLLWIILIWSLEMKERWYLYVYGKT